MLQACGYPTFVRIKEKAVENAMVIHSLLHIFSTGYQHYKFFSTLSAIIAGVML